MRLVLDTNVVVSGLLWHGAPANLLAAAERDETELCTSRILLAELSRILQRPRFTTAIAASGLSLEELVLGYAELATLVQPEPIPPTVLNDPDDDHILACAVTAKADYIVSGDWDLLVLQRFENIPIVRVVEALVIVTGSIQKTPG